MPYKKRKAWEVFFCAAAAPCSRYIALFQTRGYNHNGIGRRYHKYDYRCVDTRLKLKHISFYLYTIFKTCLLKHILPQNLKKPEIMIFIFVTTLWYFLKCWKVFWNEPRDFALVWDVHSMLNSQKKNFFCHILQGLPWIIINQTWWRNLSQENKNKINQQSKQRLKTIKMSVLLPSTTTKRIANY